MSPLFFFSIVFFFLSTEKQNKTKPHSQPLYTPPHTHTWHTLLCGVPLLSLFCCLFNLLCSPKPNNRLRDHHPTSTCTHPSSPIPICTLTCVYIHIGLDHGGLIDSRTFKDHLLYVRVEGPWLTQRENSSGKVWNVWTRIRSGSLTR